VEITVVAYLEHFGSHLSAGPGRGAEIEVHCDFHDILRE